MDREIWKLVLGAVKRASRRVGLSGRRRRPAFPDWLIVAMYLWCVWHDRPLCWACDRSHYGGLFRPRKLPSVSQFSRRVKSPAVQQVLNLVHDELAGRGLVTADGWLDGKPLLVSPVSKDRQAKRGRVSGGFAKGYKLHAFINDRRRIAVWSVTGLSAAEQSVALELLAHLPPLAAGALVRADSNYDSAALYKGFAALGGRLLTPLKGQQRVGEGGRHEVTLRQMGQARRETVTAWKEHPDLTRYVLKGRDQVERDLGTFVCTAGGLGTALPAWVRGQDRVQRYVGAKIIFHNARIEVQDRLRKKPAA